MEQKTALRMLSTSKSRHYGVETIISRIAQYAVKETLRGLFTIRVKDRHISKLRTDWHGIWL